MDLEQIRSFCRSLPAVTEDVKWGNDLCFSIGGKMFCVAAMSQPVTLSFKVRDEVFDELTATPGFKPAPYLARYKWIYLEDSTVIKSRELKEFIRASYEMIRSKLPKKILNELKK